MSNGENEYDGSLEIRRPSIILLSDLQLIKAADSNLAVQNVRDSATVANRFYDRFVQAGLAEFTMDLMYGTLDQMMVDKPGIPMRKLLDPARFQVAEYHSTLQANGLAMALWEQQEYLWHAPSLTSPSMAKAVQHRDKAWLGFLTMLHRTAVADDQPGF